MKRRRTVVVTGASTGIGRAAALRLAGHGWDVVAGVRTTTDAESLASIEGVTPLRLDVTDTVAISAAAEAIDQRVGSRGLAALVNNAGIVVAGPLETVPHEQWRIQFDVNVFGLVDVTRALLPALMRSVDPRIVVIGSISGRVGAPLLAPYVASKHAVDGIVKCLRREFDAGSPAVSLIEPGAVTTPLWQKASDTADSIEATLSDTQRRRYGRFIAAHRVALEGGEREGVAPDVVAEVIERALTVSRPRARYLVGRDAKAGGLLDRLLPDVAMERLGRVLVDRGLTAGDPAT